MINAYNEGICVEIWRKNNTTLVYLLSNCPQVLKVFDGYVIYYFWRFQYITLWLLGYRIEFSCLYLPQGHNFISTDEYVLFLYFDRSPSLKESKCNKSVGDYKDILCRYTAIYYRFPYYFIVYTIPLVN